MGGSEGASSQLRVLALAGTGCTGICSAPSLSALSQRAQCPRGGSVAGASSSSLSSSRSSVSRTGSKLPESSPGRTSQKARRQTAALQARMPLARRLVLPFFLFLLLLLLCLLLLHLTKTWSLQRFWTGRAEGGSNGVCTGSVSGKPHRPISDLVPVFRNYGDQPDKVVLAPRSSLIRRADAATRKETLNTTARISTVSPKSTTSDTCLNGPCSVVLELHSQVRSY